MILKSVFALILSFCPLILLADAPDHFGIEDYRNRHGILNTKGNKVISHLDYIDWLLEDENKSKWLENKGLQK